MCELGYAGIITFLERFSGILSLYAERDILDDCRSRYLTLSSTTTGIISTILDMCPWSSSMHGQINQGGLFSWASLSSQGSPDSLSLHSRELVFRNRAGIPPTRCEDEARGFACFASWLHQFVSAATNAAVAAARLEPSGPLHFRSPSVGSTAALSSVGRAFPRTSPRRFPRARLLLAHIPLRLPLDPFYFHFCAKHAPTSADTRNTLILSIDNVFSVSR